MKTKLVSIALLAVFLCACKNENLDKNKEQGPAVKYIGGCPDINLGTDSTYLYGDWDGDGADNVAVVRGQYVFEDLDYGGGAEQCEKLSTLWNKSQILVGDWDGNGKADFGYYKGSEFFIDIDHDNIFDKTFGFGNGSQTDHALVGDFNGDKQDDICLERDGVFFIDTNFDGKADLQYGYGNGNNNVDGYYDVYFVGDWDGDGKSNLGLLHGDRVFLDLNNGGAADLPDFQFGKALNYDSGGTTVRINSMGQVFAGKWKKDDNKEYVGFRWKNQISLDYNHNSSVDFSFGFGNYNAI